MQKDSLARFQCITDDAETLQRTVERTDEETMITVLLVDDEPLARQGLLMWLSRVRDIQVIKKPVSERDGDYGTFAASFHSWS
jgi:hypothetical protein